MTNPDPRPEAMKACPFCGGPGLLDEGHRDHWRVVCEECGASQGECFARSADPKAEAIAAWNQRAAPAVPLEVADREGSTMPKGYAEARATIERARASVFFIECWTDSEDDKKRIQSILAGLEAADMLAAIAQQQPARIEANDGVAEELLDQQISQRHRRSDPTREEALAAITFALARAGHGYERGVREAAAVAKNPPHRFLPERNPSEEIGSDEMLRTEGFRDAQRIIEKAILALLNQQDKPHG